MRVLVLETDPRPKTAIVRLLSRQSGLTPLLESDLANGTWSKSGAAVILLSEKAVRSGQRSISDVKRRFARGNLLILGYSDDAEVIGDFVRQGADGYFNLGQSDEDLVNAINVVARGAMFLPVTAARSVVSALRAKPSTPEALSEPEREMLTLLNHGLTNKEIASRTGVDEGRVKMALRRLYKRFRVRTRVHLLMKAVRNGLIRRP